MPIHVTWDNEAQTALRFAFTNPWTWDEVSVANNEAFALAATRERQYVTIFDMTEASIIPSGSFFTESKQWASVKPANAHATVGRVGAGVGGGAYDSPPAGCATVNVVLVPL